MADATKTIADLRRVRADMGYDSWGEDWDGIMGAAIALIEQQAAELERLTPRPMTIQDIEKTFNEARVHDLNDWESRLDEILDRPYFTSRSYPGDWFTLGEAQLIAQKLEREKEAARG